MEACVSCKGMFCTEDPNEEMECAARCNCDNVSIVSMSFLLGPLLVARKKLVGKSGSTLFQRFSDNIVPLFLLKQTVAHPHP